MYIKEKAKCKVVLYINQHGRLAENFSLPTYVYNPRSFYFGQIFKFPRFSAKNVYTEKKTTLIKEKIIFQKCYS